MKPSPLHGDLPPSLEKFRPLLGKAGWMWPVHHQWDLVNGFALFRKRLTLPRVPKVAEMLITADQSYQLYVNGTYVCRGPARGYQHHWPADVVEVAPYLKKGENVVAIRGYNPGFHTYQYLSQGSAGVLVAGRLGTVDMVSDRSWLAVRQGGVDKNMVTASSQLFPQENIDLAVEPIDWMSGGFSEKKAGWVTPRVTPRWDVLPWPRLSERGIPLLEETEVLPKKIVGTAEGKCAPDYVRTRNLSILRHSEGLVHQPVSGGAGEISFPATGKGRWRSVILDFGHIVVGSPEVWVEGARGGEMIDTLHFETLKADRLEPDFMPAQFCFTYLSNRMVCRKGKNHHRFYHLMGARYVLLTVRDSTAAVKVRFRLQSTGYPLPAKGAFESSDPVMVNIWEACVRTQRACSLDAYIDTPWREQAQWWGDARVQGWNTFHLNGDDRLFRRGISQIAAQTTDDGLTYGHAPTKAHGCVLPDFTLIWMITLWDHWWQTGSTEAFRAHRPQVERALAYFENATDKKTGLLPHDPRFWLFLDWTGIFKDGYPAVYNFWLVVALEKLAQLAKAEGDEGFAKRLQSWSKRVRQALLKLQMKDGCWADGVGWDGKVIPSRSIHTQVMALMTGMGKGAETEMISRHLLPWLTGESKPEVAPSAYWSTYVFTEMARRGHGDAVLGFIRDKWKVMADYGSTFEIFIERPGEFSRSHAWSAHPLFHLMQTIGGIVQTAPGWKAFRFDPVFTGTHGGATVPTPRGPIVSRWERRGDGIHLHLAWPKGVQAEISPQMGPLKPFRATGPGEVTWIRPTA